MICVQFQTFAPGPFFNRMLHESLRIKLEIFNVSRLLPFCAGRRQPEAGSED
jgi:hypothetical protein